MCYKTQRGLTLIEILVALSIIATLSALLYPVVASSLRRSYVAACQSQLRQVGQAIRMYQADFDTEDWPCRLGKLVPYYISPEVLVCPWETRAAREQVRLLQRKWLPEHWSSYFVFCRVGIDDISMRQGTITYSEIMEQRGERTPIVICREHRSPFVLNSNGAATPLAWAYPEMPVVVLRKDGSIDLSMRGGIGLYTSTIQDAMEL